MSKLDIVYMELDEKLSFVTLYWVASLMKLCMKDVKKNLKIIGGKVLVYMPIIAYGLKHCWCCELFKVYSWDLCTYPIGFNGQRCFLGWGAHFLEYNKANLCYRFKIFVCRGGYFSQALPLLLSKAEPLK